MSFLNRYLIETNILTTEYQYEGKPFLLHGIDTCNQGIYRLFNGKTIKMVTDEEGTICHVRQHRVASWVKVVLLISHLVIFPIFCLSLIAKYWSWENRRITQKVKQKQLNSLREAVTIIKTACRTRLMRKNAAAIKIQQTYRAYYRRTHPSLTTRVYRKVQGFIPSMKTLVPMAFQWAMQNCAKEACDLMLAAVAPALGVNPADVQLAVKIEKQMERW